MYIGDISGTMLLPLLIITILVWMTLHFIMLDKIT